MSKSLSSGDQFTLDFFAQVAADGSPQHPPLYDHTFWGVGNEDRIERRANWALKVIGKMNGTLLEAMIANGTIGSEVILAYATPLECNTCKIRSTSNRRFVQGRSMLSCHWAWNDCLTPAIVLRPQAEVVDPALVSEIHQAMNEQNREVDLNAPGTSFQR